MKRIKSKKRTKMTLFPSRYPFHMLAVDMIDLQLSDNCCNYCKTMIDRIQNHWLYKYCIPEYLLSDNVPELTADIFKNFTNIYGIKHMQSTTYDHQTNWVIERLHLKLKEKLVMAAAKTNRDLFAGHSWNDLILQILMAYNSTVNRMTEYSPHVLIYTANLQDFQ